MEMSSLAHTSYVGKREQTGPVRIWLQWVSANAGAELIGLGSSALLWIAMLALMEERLGILLSSVAVVLGSTLLEGTAVGLGQWFVLRKIFPTMRWQSWLLATAAGAFVAWTLGMLPSTMMNMGESSVAAGTVDPPAISNGLMYLLAAGMGLVLGPILAWPQWLVLRHHLKRAIWWIPANALAWAAGMVIIFVGANSVPEGSLTWMIALIVLVSLTIAGAVVGAIHGLFLLWLVHSDSD